MSESCHALCNQPQRVPHLPVYMVLDINRYPGPSWQTAHLTKPDSIDDTIREKLGVLLTDPPTDPPRVCEHVKRILVPVPEHNESKDVSDTWIKWFGRWAAQESLSDDLTLLFASEYMQKCDYSWARQFSVGHTSEDFVPRYFQRTITSDLKAAQETTQMKLKKN